jgi:hypothetical protein
VNADDVRRRLRLRADELGLDFQQAIQYYAMERFLFRLSQSAWSERFIVKGAVMLRVWDAAVARPTRDIDFLGRIDNTPGAVRAAVQECLCVEVADDGLAFSQDIEVAQAMLDDRYPGVRVKLRGDLAGARFTLRLDIGVDDVVVPTPGWVDYPPLLDQPAPRILAYDPATAVAEKFESIVDLGLINSRLKDFYDLWMLAGGLSFEGQTLADALSATFRSRGTELPVEAPVALTGAFVEQSATAAMWRAYRTRHRRLHHAAGTGCGARHAVRPVVGTQGGLAPDKVTSLQSRSGSAARTQRRRASRRSAAAPGVPSAPVPRTMRSAAS